MSYYCRDCGEMSEVAPAKAKNISVCDLCWMIRLELVRAGPSGIGAVTFKGIQRSLASGGGRGRRKIEKTAPAIVAAARAALGGERG